MSPLYFRNHELAKQPKKKVQGTGGGTYIIKLFPQLLQVDNATPFALNEVGKTSAGKAHGTGPHVAPKASI